MRVLTVEPMTPPYEQEIGEGLIDLQRAVGGFIEAVYEGDCALIVNEDGKLEGLPLNRSLKDEDGRVTDVIAGTFIVTGLTEEGFGDLPEEQVRAYSERFRAPEQFLFAGSRILSVPVPEEEWRTPPAPPPARTPGTGHETANERRQHAEPYHEQR